MRSGKYEASDSNSAGTAVTFLLIGLGAGHGARRRNRRPGQGESGSPDQGDAPVERPSDIGRRTLALRPRASDVSEEPRREGNGKGTSSLVPPSHKNSAL